ncbi:MAG: type III secretion system outer membrane ring subunit SctC [Kiritimatiellae bacterium]|nr:type III secretion system outer membrane ring subunit SctC [Kiritimatiellia bacterium]
MLVLCCCAAFVAVADEPAASAEKPVTPSIPWKLPSYTLVARNMDLRVALDTFAVAEGLSVVMSPSVVGRFSGDFKDVPPGEFLDRIATTHNLMWYYDGAALYVYGAGEIATMLVDLRYMKAGEVRAMLAELGVEDRRFPLKTTSNDELVMVSGPPRYVSLVAEMIARADSLREKRTFNEVEARIFPLVYTWADDITFRANSPESTLQLRGIAHILEEIMTMSSANANVRETAITNEVSHFEAAQMAAYHPVIRPENRLNAVIVRDVVSRMPMYEKLIKQLDVPQRLVEIDITTVELSRKDALDWQLSLAASGNHGHSDMGAGQNAANLFSPAAIAGKGLAGALTHVHSAYSLAVSLTALREKGKARSVSRTSLLTVNNLAAEMSDTQSYHAKVVGTEVATLESVSAGTRLQIKPRILPSPSTNVPNQVWLSLELGDGGFESIAVDAMPMTRSSTLQTQTAVFEDESIVLAGYLRDIEESAGWGIPYLRDIPWVGWIFGGASTRKETVQRLFILTPHVIDLDVEMLARLQATRQRDITFAEQIQDDADATDEYRKSRDLERKHSNERRHEKWEDAYERRSAELDHARNVRHIEREKLSRILDADIKRWEEEEEAMKAAAAVFEEATDKQAN